MTIFAILLMLTLGLKKRGQQNKCTLILKWEVEKLRTSIQGSGKFQAEPVPLFSLQKRIAFKRSLDLPFYALIIRFFRSP